MSCPTNNLAILIEAAELETFDPDAVLMVQGDASDFAMLILEGEVTVSADSARGAIPISTLHAPSLVGELGALAQLPRSATARACTPVTALALRTRSAGRESLHATPSLLIDVIGRMGERMRKFNGAISLYTHALGALERHEFDPALLEELRNPIPDLADFGQTFGRMAEQIILRRQRDDEMASAAVIQRALLPRVTEFAEESSLDVWAAMTPARDVGGDFFELVPLADGRVALGVGDVCGKGVPAALFMGITKTLIRINLRENPDLPGAIVKANAFLADNNAGQFFATALYVAYDPRSGALEYCNCGHLPGYIRRAGGAVETLPVGRPAGRPVRPDEDDGASGATSAGRPFLPLHRWRHRSRGPGRAPVRGGAPRKTARQEGPRRPRLPLDRPRRDGGARVCARTAPVRRHHLPRAEALRRSPDFGAMVAAGASG